MTLVLLIYQPEYDARENERCGHADPISNGCSSEQCDFCAPQLSYTDLPFQFGDVAYACARARNTGPVGFILGVDDVAREETSVQSPISKLVYDKTDDACDEKECKQDVHY